MRINELELLINDYKNAVTGEERLIKRKLEAIASLFSECDTDELVFANEITVEFIRIIYLLKKQYEREAAPEIFAPATEKSISYSYIPRQAEYRSRFSNGDELIGAFYDHFKKDHELSYYDVNTFRFSSDGERKEKVNATLWDYAARIYTFANRHLYEIFTSEEVARSGAPDSIIFIYENLEIILARFNTKDECGVSIKQRVNIRSALRKLNEFKKDISQR